MTKAGVNVHDPRWLREVQIKDLQTNTLIHQTKYTDVWERWSAALGRSPTAVEIVNKANELERAYAAQGGYYRQGANLPGSIDWVTLLNLLEKVK